MDDTRKIINIIRVKIETGFDVKVKEKEVTRQFFVTPQGNPSSTKTKRSQSELTKAFPSSSSSRRTERPLLREFDQFLMCSKDLAIVRCQKRKDRIMIVNPECKSCVRWDKNGGRVEWAEHWTYDRGSGYMIKQTRKSVWYSTNRQIEQITETQKTVFFLPAQ